MQCPSSGFRTAVCALKAAAHPSLSSCFYKFYSPNIDAVPEFSILIRGKCNFKQWLGSRFFFLKIVVFFFSLFSERAFWPLISPSPGSQMFPLGWSRWTWTFRRDIQMWFMFSSKERTQNSCLWASGGQQAVPQQPCMGWLLCGVRLNPGAGLFGDNRNQCQEN